VTRSVATGSEHMLGREGDDCQCKMSTFLEFVQQTCDNFAFELVGCYLCLGWMLADVKIGLCENHEKVVRAICDPID
jgi:hypothetical protein